MPGTPTFEESSEDGHLNVVLPFRAHAEHGDLNQTHKITAQERDTEQVGQKMGQNGAASLFPST